MNTKSLVRTIVLAWRPIDVGLHPTALESIIEVKCDFQGTTVAIVLVNVSLREA